MVRAGVRLEGVSKVTKEQLAERLNGRQYGREITREEEKLAKESGLVVVFGASDDLCEMRGAIDDEFGCYDGGEIECEEYPETLIAKWCPSDECSWGYETDLPHADFNIYEDDMLYCVGIVVDLKEYQTKDSGKNNGWISVKDKMPENYKPVLVYDQEWGIRIDTVSIEPFEEFAHYGYVTHWQSLPEPPERGDNDD